MALHKLWELIAADLGRARNTLPDSAQAHVAVRQYQEFIDHNELELACGMLETYAHDHPVSREFWIALRDAASKMELPDRASQYEANMESLS